MVLLFIYHFAEHGGRIEQSTQVKGRWDPSARQKDHEGNQQATWPDGGNLVTKKPESKNEEVGV